MIKKIKELKETDAISVVTVKSRPSGAAEKSDAYFKKGVPAIIAFLGIFGSVFSFLTSFNVPVNTSDLILYMLLFFSAYSVLFTVSKKPYIYAFISLALFVLLFWSNSGEYVEGFKAVSNAVYSCVYNTKTQYYNLPAWYITEELTTSFITVTSFWFTFLICWNTLVRPSIFMAMIFTVPIIAAALINNREPGLLSSAMIIAFWTGMICLKCKSKPLCKKKTVKKGSRRFIPNEPDKNNSAAQACAFWVITVTLMLFIVISGIVTNLDEEYISDFRHKSWDYLYNLRDNLAEKFSSENGIFNAGSSKTNSSSKYDDGSLGNRDSISFSGQTDLIVDISVNPNESIYLKSYNGSLYDGIRWNDLPEEAYEEYRTLFSGKERVQPQTLSSEYVYLLGSRFFNTITVKSMLKRYDSNFLPYYMYPESIPDGASYIGDRLISMENKKEYTADFLCGYNYRYIQPPPDEINNSSLTAFNETELKYRDFAFEYYTIVPDTPEMEELYKEYGYLFNWDYLSENLGTRGKNPGSGTSKYKNPGYISYEGDYPHGYYDNNNYYFIYGDDSGYYDDTGKYHSQGSQYDEYYDEYGNPCPCGVTPPPGYFDMDGIYHYNDNGRYGSYDNGGNWRVDPYGYFKKYIYGFYISPAGITEYSSAKSLQAATFRKLDEIRNALAQDAEYSLSPGKTPEDKDFVSYFLTENHKGYCAHFATAGAVLSRMAGIPSRYAAGYVAPLSDFNYLNENPDGSYTIEIPDRYAHAWTEVYIIGVGWIPYDFTPGALNGQLPSEQTDTSEDTTAGTETEETTESTASSTNSITTDTESTTESAPHETTGSDSAGGMITPEQPDSGFRIPPAVIIAAVIVASVLIIILRRVISVKKRKKSFRINPNEGIINRYYYITELLDYMNIKNPNLPELVFADIIQEKSDLFEAEKIHKISHIALKAAHSNTESTPEEFEYMAKETESFAEKVYNKQGFFGKLVMKYVLNFI